MGRNGCGKTTLLRCGLGLTWAEFGVVLLEGRRVSGGLPEMSQAGVAFLPDRRLLSPRLTLREHLAAFEQARHEVLDPGPAATLDVEDLLDSRSFRMSGGEQRRAAILVTGHEVEDLFDLADEVIWMVAGTTHGLGTPEEAARHAQFRLEYLGTRRLPE